MRIMTTRKLCFYSPDRKEKFQTSGNRIIEDCPEWAQNDDMFKAALRAGILTLLAKPVLAKEEVAIQEAAPANAHEEAKLAEEKGSEEAEGNAKDPEEAPKKKTSKKKA